jgi:hypothetical protein
MVAIVTIAIVAIVAVVTIAMVAIVAVVTIAMVAIVAVVAIAMVAVVAVVAIAIVAFITRLASHARSDPLFQFFHDQVQLIFHTYLFVCCCYVSPAFWIQTNEPAGAVRFIIWRPPWHRYPPVTFVTWGSGCSKADIPSPARD